MSKSPGKLLNNRRVLEMTLYKVFHFQILLPRIFWGHLVQMQNIIFNQSFRMFWNNKKNTTGVDVPIDKV